MIRSIGGQIAIGLAIAGFISAIVLVLVAGNQYGFFSENPPSLAQAWPEIVDHIIIPLSVFLLTFGVGAFWSVRRMVRRLAAATRDVIQAADNMGGYDANQNKLPKEVDAFAVAVSQLTTKLEDYARRQEDFAVDAAHELKTPLGILALELDKLPKNDADRLRRQLESMSEMVEQFLLLARSQFADSSSARSTVKLDNIARRVAAELAPAAVAQGKTIAFQSNGVAHEANGLEEAITAAVRTLTENAIHATPEGGEVVLETGTGPIISVFDGGDGLDQEKLDNLKARGVRADRRPRGGAGLGLAIADRVAEAHGGNLRTTLPERAGVRLCFGSLRERAAISA